MDVQEESSQQRSPSGRCFIYFGKKNNDAPLPILDEERAFDGTELLAKMKDFQENRSFLRNLGSHFDHHMSRTSPIQILRQLGKTKFASIFEGQTIDEDGKNDVRKRFYRNKLSGSESVVDSVAIKVKDFVPGKSARVFGIRYPGGDSDEDFDVLIIVPKLSDQAAVEDEFMASRNAAEDLITASETLDVVGDDTQPEPAQVDVVTAVPPTLAVPGETVAEDSVMVGNDAANVGRKEAFPQQKEIADKLLARAKCVLGDISKYTDVRILLVSPVFLSLRSQTSHRAFKSGVASTAEEAKKMVVPHDVKACSEWMRFHTDLFNPAYADTLFVIVDDECHYAPTAKMAHDVLVNFSQFKMIDTITPKIKRTTNKEQQVEDETREKLLRWGKPVTAKDQKNLLVLQVSATPQNCLTENSRIPEDNVVRWSYESDALFDVPGVDAMKINSSLYRSLDAAFESVCWRLVDRPDKPRVLRIKAPDGTVKELNLAAELKNLSFAPFDFWDFWGRVTRAVFEHRATTESWASEWRSIKFEQNDSQGEPRLVLKFPATGWSLGNNPFARETLGFGDLDEKATPWITCDLSKDRKTLMGSRLPKLCEPVEGGTVPLAYQHVRMDTSVQTMIERWTTKQQERKKKKKQDPTSTNRRVASAAERRIVEHAAHILVADYIVSLVYFAFFRVKDEFVSILTSVYRRPFDGPVLSPLGAPPNAPAVQLQSDDGDASDDDGERNKVKATPQPAEPLSPQEQKFRSRVQMMLDKIDEIKKECGKWKTNETLEDFAGTLDLVMEDFEEEARGSLVKDDVKDHVLVWTEIVRKKLECEKRSSESNDRLSWYTESDRLIKTLLEVDKPMGDGDWKMRKGSMVFARVYGRDRANLLQLHLRNVMRMLGLYYHVRDTQSGGLMKDAKGEPLKRPVFAVLSDNGDADLLKEMRDEQWSDAFLGKQVDEDGNDVSTFLKRSQVKSFSDYEVFLDIPCLVLLCEKGRMGDTFPHSLSLIDVRIRGKTCGKYTSMIQEFGRMCRYPAVDPLWSIQLDSTTAVTDEVKKSLETSMKQGHPVALFRPIQAMETSSTGVIAPLRPGVLVATGKFLGQAEYGGQLDALCRRAQKGDVFLRYRHPLPTLLVSKTISDKLRTAVQYRNLIATDRGLVGADVSGQLEKLQLQLEKLRKLPRISECFDMDLDPYMELINNTKKKTIADVLQVSEKGPCKSLEQVYRKMYKPDPDHYDHENGKRNQQSRRLLLFAECQIGKTGVFMEFLYSLQQQCKKDPKEQLTVPDIIRRLMLQAVRISTKRFTVPIFSPVLEWDKQVQAMDDSIQAVVETVDSSSQGETTHLLVGYLSYKEPGQLREEERLGLETQSKFFEVQIRDYFNSNVAHRFLFLAPQVGAPALRKLQVKDFDDRMDDLQRLFESAPELQGFSARYMTRKDISPSSPSSSVGSSIVLANTPSEIQPSKDAPTGPALKEHSRSSGEEKLSATIPSQPSPSPSSTGVPHPKRSKGDERPVLATPQLKSKQRSVSEGGSPMSAAFHSSPSRTVGRGADKAAPCTPESPATGRKRSIDSSGSDSRLVLKKNRPLGESIEGASRLSSGDRIPIQMSTSSSSSKSPLPAKSSSTGVSLRKSASSIKQDDFAVDGTSPNYKGYGLNSSSSVIVAELGTRPVPAQIFGDKGLVIPDGLHLSHAMFGLVWAVELSHVSPSLADGVVRIKWKVSWPPGNMSGSPKNVFEHSETKEQAEARQKTGKTITNALLKAALIRRKEFVEAQRDQRDVSKEETSRAGQELQILVEILARENFKDDGLNFFGLQDPAVQIEAFARRMSEISNGGVATAMNIVAAPKKD